jgi:hypothetical protein
LYGCGDRLLTVNVDVLSFMDSTAVKQTYGVNPVIPAGGPIPVVFQIPPQQVNLTEGLADITDIQSVTLHLGSKFANETGSAEVLLEVYISDTQTDPYTTTPYVHETILLEPATTDTVRVNIAGDDRLGDLLTGEAAQVGIRTTFDSSGSTDNVVGTETLILFNATVVAKRHIP